MGLREREAGTNTLYDAGSVYYLDTAQVDISTGLDLTHTTPDLLDFPLPTGFYKPACYLAHHPPTPNEELLRTGRLFPASCRGFGPA